MCPSALLLLQLLANAPRKQQVMALPTWGDADVVRGSWLQPCSAILEVNQRMKDLFLPLLSHTYVTGELPLLRAALNPGPRAPGSRPFMCSSGVGDLFRLHRGAWSPVVISTPNNAASPSCITLYPSLLPPGISSQVDELHPSPSLTFCFWGNPNKAFANIAISTSTQGQEPQEPQPAPDNACGLLVSATP